MLFMRGYYQSWVRTNDFPLRLCERNIRKVTNELIVTQKKIQWVSKKTMKMAD